MLQVKDLNFAFEENKPVLQQVSFEVKPGEIVCILGESGSGKSTLLKLIYGELLPPTGDVLWQNQVVRDPAKHILPGHPDIKYVAQDFSLENYISVVENVGKHLSNVYAEAKKQRIEEVLHALEIKEYANKKPLELSGGQQQRVAIARAVAQRPKLLLLDEPFSQLDAALHIRIRNQLIQFLRKNGIAALFTSHRSEDALGFSDQIISLYQGKIQQIAAPKEMYLYPQNEEVVKLFGKYNLLPAAQAPDYLIERNFLKKHLLVYPEEIKLSLDAPLTAYVTESRFMGNGFEIEVRCKGNLLTLYHDRSILPKTKVQLKIERWRWL